MYNKGGGGGCAVSPGSILEIPGVAGISGREANELATRDPNPVNRDTDPRSNPPPTPASLVVPCLCASP